MITNPDLFFDEFVEAGSDSFIVHWEGNNNLHRTIQRVKSLGKRIGVAINPATPASALEEIVQDVDLVLVMTVNPGFGHQHFIHTKRPICTGTFSLQAGDNLGAWLWGSSATVTENVLIESEASPDLDHV